MWVYLKLSKQAQGVSSISRKIRKLCSHISHTFWNVVTKCSSEQCFLDFRFYATLDGPNKNIKLWFYWGLYKTVTKQPLWIINYQKDNSYIDTWQIKPWQTWKIGNEELQMFWIQPFPPCQVETSKILAILGNNIQHWLYLHKLPATCHNLYKTFRHNTVTAICLANTVKTSAAD